MFDNELAILGLYGLLVALTILLQASGAFAQLGMGYLLSARDERRSLSGITGRIERAVNNSAIAMALFAPAVLILAAKDSFSASSLQAAQLFLIARLVYLPAYAFGITGLRTLAWLAGFGATVVLYLLGL